MSMIIRGFDSVLRRYTPDPFVIAILLTLVTIVLARFQTEHSTTEIVMHWGNGFWELAEFTLQMSMVLLGGYVVAKSPPVQKVLLGLVGLVNNRIQAVLFCTFAAIVASWINWGFGLVIGGVVAAEVARRLPTVSFRVLVASSYSGFIVWHGGLSGSIPLKTCVPSDLTSPWLGKEGFVPLSETTFGSINLIALGCMLVVLPITNLFIMYISGNDEERNVAIAVMPGKAKNLGLKQGNEPGAFLENSVVVSLLLVGIAVYYLVGQSFSGSFKLNLSSVNFIFYVLALSLHGSPRAFIQSVTDAAPKIAPILILYPLYAGIMSVLRETGLAHVIAEFFVNHSTKETFPLMTFYSAGLINLFVPSGGGQWSVQAPIVLPAAQALGADIPKTIMAVAWGDAWTNLAQPFWAVPLLTVAGLEIKDIIGYCIITLLTTGAVLSLVFLLI